MKKYLITLSLFALSCQSKFKRPVYVEYFKAGQILPPDGLCNDSLRVVDAINLNIQMGMYEQGLNDFGDKQLDSVFHVYCMIIK